MRNILYWDTRGWRKSNTKILTKKWCRICAIHGNKSVKGILLQKLMHKQKIIPQGSLVRRETCVPKKVCGWFGMSRVFGPDKMDAYEIRKQPVFVLYQNDIRQHEMYRWIKSGKNDIHKWEKENEWRKVEEEQTIWDRKWTLRKSSEVRNAEKLRQSRR